MLVAYILVLFVMIVIETTRRAKDRLIENQNLRLRKLRRAAITANRRLETAVLERTQELEEQTRIAVQANRAKSEFLATMSHEIRTPLNAVIGLSEIELRNDLPESSKDNIQQIYQSGSSLLGIINNILDISKIEAGSFELVLAEYETAPFISDTINLNRIRIASKPVSIILEINKDFPRKLIGDELRVKQVLNNLLSNAIKYTQQGTVTLNISSEPLKVNPPPSPTGSDQRSAVPLRRNKPDSLTPEPHGNILIRFTIKDTGLGIREEDIEKLFTSYTQLDAMANRKVEGTGLGLAIAKNLAQAMGGNISVESEYDKGSTFTLEIIQGLVYSANPPPSPMGEVPLRYLSFETIEEKTAEDLKEFRYVAEREGIDFVRTWMPNGKVLVVDDILVNLKVARGLLEPYGLQVDTANSGQRAIELVKLKQYRGQETEGYDLVFMDHMMPEMDGVEAMKAIRAWENEQLEGNSSPPVQKWQLPIIVLTANAVLGMKEKFIEKGFNDFLTKPIDVFLLDEILNRWVPKEKRAQKTDSGDQAVLNR
jgi:signal transduction histidine kinase/FixJ family two-component response regulator